jgi:hypothetical protein
MHQLLDLTQFLPFLFLSINIDDTKFSSIAAPINFTANGIFISSSLEDYV